MTERGTDVATQLQEARQRLVVEYLEAVARGDDPFGPRPGTPAGFQRTARASIHKVRIRFQSVFRSHR